jgi:hypothetical protein
MFKRQITLAISVSALSVGVAIGANAAAAQTARGLVDPRLFQAYSENVSEQSRPCVPANGAQIMGGFAGSHDLIDTRTGEICGKR